MAEDYEDMYDIESMTDDELHALVQEQLGDRADIEMSGLETSVSEGRVTLAGRVGTEAEYQVIEHVLTDVLGVNNVTNDLVVDELVRQEQPEAADRANAEVYDQTGGATGGANRTEDSAEHLLTDTAADHRGTSDMGEAIERGHSYNPPDSPIQEGTWSKEKH